MIAAPQLNSMMLYDVCYFKCWCVFWQMMQGQHIFGGVTVHFKQTASFQQKPTVWHRVKVTYNCSCQACCITGIFTQILPSPAYQLPCSVGQGDDRPRLCPGVMS